jgi:arylsulfatase A-like enzyme
MVESVDDSVGRVAAKLDELGLAENTVVVFYSDNGGLGTVTSMAPLRGSKGMLYEGGIREPLIVRWPGRTTPGAISRVPVIGTDVYPTFLEVAGVDAPEQPLDGVSIVPLLQGGPVPRALAERPLFWHFPAYLEAGRNTGPWRTTPVAAVRQGDYKLLEFFEDGRLELYDLGADVGETTDLAGAMPDKVAELAALMQAWRGAIGAYVPSELNPEYDPGRPPHATSVLR